MRVAVLLVLAVILACCASVRTAYITWSDDLIYGIIPEDHVLDEYMGQPVLVSFRWAAPSSILQSTMVIGELVSYDEDDVVVRTCDGKDGASMSEAYWQLLVERGRARTEDSYPNLVFMPKSTIGNVFLLKRELECHTSGLQPAFQGRSASQGWRLGE